MTKEFVNRAGQTLSHGDRVLVIAQGNGHTIKELFGTFAGVSASGSPQVFVTRKRWDWRKPDGTKTQWYANCERDGVKYIGRECMVRGTFPAGRVYLLRF